MEDVKGTMEDVKEDMYNAAMILCSMKYCKTGFYEPQIFSNNNVNNNNFESRIQLPDLNEEVKDQEESPTVTICRRSTRLILKRSTQVLDPVLEFPQYINNINLSLLESEIEEVKPKSVIEEEEAIAIRNHCRRQRRLIIMRPRSPAVVELPPPIPQLSNLNEEVVIIADERGGEEVIPEGIRDVIGECSPPLMKELTTTDKNSNQARLGLKKEFAIKYLIPMLNEDENLEDGIDVTTYDRDGREFKMKFILWCGKLYVLTSGWTSFCESHGFIDVQDRISTSIRMFRHIQTRRLCFFISHRCM